MDAFFLFFVLIIFVISPAILNFVENFSPQNLRLTYTNKMQINKKLRVATKKGSTVFGCWSVDK
jgi:hypothetical protein